MLLNGLKLLFAPARTLASGEISAPKTPRELAATAATAALAPAIAAVGGHLGSSALGFASAEVAVQRAAVAFVASVCGALVAVPALTLAMMRILEQSRAPSDIGNAGRLALCLVWPAWAAGIVLAVPPLVGLGPEIGEIAWFVVGLAAALRVLSLQSLGGAQVRRRWASPFLARSALALVFLFAAVPIAPAMAVRAVLGVQGELLSKAPAPISWPLPEAPDW